MVVYIEWAFAENFLLDGVLLYLALKAVRKRIVWKRLCLASGIGAGFALLFPLLLLPVWAAYTLKFAVGFLLCFLAFGRVKTKQEWGRYAMNVAFFFVFSFGFGGALLGAAEDFTGGVSPVFVFVGFVLLTVFSLFFIKKLREKRAVEQFLYPCEAIYKEKRVNVLGFYDSGNLAKQNSLPVCFLSPDIAFDLFCEEYLEKATGQVCDEITIATMSGEKKLRLFQGKVALKTNGKRLEKEVYFAVSGNMLSREYKLILSSRIFEEEG